MYPSCRDNGQLRLGKDLHDLVTFGYTIIRNRDNVKHLFLHDSRSYGTPRFIDHGKMAVIISHKD